MQMLAHAFRNWTEQLSVKLWQRSPVLATVWGDGLVLSYRPALLLVAMGLTFALGFAEGALHWSLYTIGDGQLTDGPAFTFVQMLPFVLLIAAIGAFDMRLGLVLLASYVLGEQLIAGTSFVNPRGLNGFFWNLTHIRLAQFITYILFWALAITPRMIARVFVASLSPLHDKPRLASLIALLPLAGMVTVWALAAPMLMRPLWLWSFADSSSIIVPYYISVVMPWLVLAALAGALARMALEELASRDQPFVARLQALEAQFPPPATPPTSKRPLWARLAVLPAFITLMSMGLITPVWPTAFLMFGTLYALNAAASLILPKLPRWMWLMAQVRRMPLLVRVVCLLAANYALAWLVLQAPGASLRFHHDVGAFGVQLTTLVLGFALALLLLPEATNHKDRTQPQKL